MVLSQDAEKGRVALSTRKLERKKGDMLRDPQKVCRRRSALRAADLEAALPKTWHSLAMQLLWRLNSSSGFGALMHVTEPAAPTQLALPSSA